MTIDERDAALEVERLYRAHQRPITAYLVRLVGNRETAEDLCQETFLKAMRAWERHDPHASAVSWLYRIATNAAYDSLRRQRALRWTSLDHANDLAGPESGAEERVLAGAIMRAALARLPPGHRAALLLTSGGYTAGEVASALRCSPTAVRMRLYRARARLRELDSMEA
jgi:RNA polymerase sigma-70 factor (ECF subfamily)